MKKNSWVLVCLAVSPAWWLPQLSFSQESGATPQPAVDLPTVEVVGALPVGGAGIALNEFAANVQKINAQDIQTQGVTNLADLINNNLGSVSLSNGTGNPYQNDVNYRGFQASSLLGAPVGVSVYFDGVRMNEPFGSVVNWDLIPTNAVSKLQLMPGSNPVFGLNTLGGALVVETKNGKTNAGSSLSATLGSYNRVQLGFEKGWVDTAHNTDYFFAGNIDRQNGYRDHSGSDVKQFFEKTRWRGDKSKNTLEFSMALADTSLSGTQSLPLDMMSNPRSAYTWPDTTANQMALFNLKGTHQLDDDHQLSGNVFYRQSNAHNINSNAALDDGCYVTINGVTSLADSTSTSGTPVAATSPTHAKCYMAPNGSTPNSATNSSLGFARWTNSINTSLIETQTRQETVGTSLQWSSFAKLFEKENSLTVGGSFDRSKISYQQTTFLAQLINYQTVVTPNKEYGFTSNGLVPSATNLPAFTASNVISGVTLDSYTTNLSAYFTNNIKLTEQLNATASGSFNYTALNQSGANSQYLNDDGGYSWTDSVTNVKYYNPSYLNAWKYNLTQNTIPAGATAGPQTNDLSGTHSYARFNPSVGVNYNVDPRLGFFGGYSESMRAPTSIELSCADPNRPCALPTGFNGDPDLKAVVAHTFELGGRGKMFDHTFWNAAIYSARLSNDIQFIASSSALGYFANVGDTERKGLEVGTQTQLKQWFFSANYGFVNATYLTPFTTASGQDVVSGNKIPGIAQQTLKLRSAYTVNPNWRVGANLLLVSGQYAHGNESNTDPDGKVPGYALVHLDVHHKIDAHWSASLNINNLFNKQYASYGLSGTTSIYSLNSQQFITPAPTRAAWVGLMYKF